MGNIFVVVNQKGGVGKTTTAVNLTAGLALEEHMAHPDNPGKVLFVTLDPQADGTDILAREMVHDQQSVPTTQGVSLAELLLDDDPPPAMRLVRQAKIPTRLKDSNLSYIPTHPAAMREAMERILTVDAREHRLREALEPLENYFRYIVIDTPTTVNIFTMNALTAATHYLVPLVPTGAGFRFLSDLDATIRRVQKRLNPSLRLLGVLPSRCVLNRSETQLVLDELKQRFGENLFEPIAERADVSLAFSNGLDIFSFRPPRNLADGYISGNDAAREFGAFVRAVYNRTAH